MVSSPGDLLTRCGRSMYGNTRSSRARVRPVGKDPGSQLTAIDVALVIDDFLAETAQHLLLDVGLFESLMAQTVAADEEAAMFDQLSRQPDSYRCRCRR